MMRHPAITCPVRLVDDYRLCVIEDAGIMNPLAEVMEIVGQNVEFHFLQVTEMSIISLKLFPVKTAGS